MQQGDELSGRPSPDQTQAIERRETIKSLISKHGFMELVQELRDYALSSESELGLPEALQNYWGRVSELLEQILEMEEEVEDYEPMEEQ